MDRAAQGRQELHGDRVDAHPRDALEAARVVFYVTLRDCNVMCNALEAVRAMFTLFLVTQ